MSAPPRVSAHVHYNPEKGHALLSCNIYEGEHGYLTTTAALTSASVRDLRNELTRVLAEMQAAEGAPETTRPMCRGCLNDVSNCVCALRAAAEKARRDCAVCNSFGKICCKLHREPVRS